MDRTGQQLGNYRLLRPLGQGSFANVYLGTHLHLNNLVAIKVLHMRLMGSNLEQFRNEARTIANLRHPHIIRVFDFGEENDVCFLVMDYAPNGTLRQLYPKGTVLPPTVVASYVQQIASALQIAHDRKLVHRDIKPENMLLGQNGEVLLSDFGLVSIAQSSASLSTKETAGTIHYMAPEQIQGKPRPASDQYSLAVIVYEWLTGAYLFSGTYWEVVSQHLSTSPAPLRQIVPSIPPELEEVVLIALNKDPHERFRSIRAFAVAFQQACMPSSSIYSIPTPAVPSFPDIPLSPLAEEMPDNFTAFPESAEKPPTVVPAELKDSDAITPVSSPPGVSLPSLPTRKLSRRAILGTLAGLAVGGSGLVALVLHRYLSPASAISASSSWSSLPSLLLPEVDNTAVYARLQQKEYIYMSGGNHGQYQPLYENNLYRYDIADARWETVQSDFPSMIDNAVANDGQGHLFFTAGYSPDTDVTTLLYKYQLATGALQKIVPPPQVLFGFGASMLADQQGHLYLTQGFMKVHDQAGTGWYRYTIAQDHWDVLAPLPMGVSFVVLAFADQGSIVMIGGETDTRHHQTTARIYRYDIAHNTWKLEQATAPLAFSEAASCPLKDGQILVIGGYDSTHDITLDKVWLVDLSTLNWTPLASLPSGGSRLGAAVSDGAGHVYLVRGNGSNPDRPTQDFWRLS